MKMTTKKIVLAATILGTIAAAMPNTAQAGCRGGGGRSRGGLSLGIAQAHFGSRRPAARRSINVHVHRPAPDTHQVVAPVQHATPVQHSAPVQHVAPIQHLAPIQDVAPSYQPAPVQHYAPVVRSAPSPQTSYVPQQNVVVTQSTVIASQPVVKAVPKPTVTPVAAKPAVTEASALAMLASLNTSDQYEEATSSVSNIPTFAPAKSSADQQRGHVGTWSVTLPGNQAVTLVLGADQSFTWTATKDSNSSSFSGQYRLVEGKLVLVRSGDLQKMEGTWTATDNGFEFNVGSQTAGGLRFSRS